MAFYRDSEQFYASGRALFECVEASYPKAQRAIRGSQMVIRFRLREPAAEIHIDGRQDPVRVTFGPSEGAPDLDIALEMDTLHRILLDELSLTAALGSGQMQVQGPVYRALALGELIVACQRCYPGVLKAQGLAA